MGKANGCKPASLQACNGGGGGGETLGVGGGSLQGRLWESVADQEER